MKKLFTLFVIVLGLSLSSFNTANGQEPEGIFPPDIEYDYVFDIAPINGNNQSVTVFVGEAVPSNHILSSPIMGYTVNGKSMTFTFSYSAWKAAGSPQSLFTGIILSDGVINILFRFQ